MVFIRASLASGKTVYVYLYDEFNLCSLLRVALIFIFFYISTLKTKRVAHLCHTTLEIPVSCVEAGAIFGVGVKTPPGYL